MGIHDKTGFIDMKLSGFIHVLIIHSNADYLGDKHRMTSQFPFLSNFAFHINRTLIDSHRMNMLHRNRCQSGFCEFINISSTDHTTIVACFHKRLIRKIDHKLSCLFQNLIRIA